MALIDAGDGTGRGTVAPSEAPPHRIAASAAAAHESVELWGPQRTGIFGRAVRGLDRWLRRRQGIYEFSRHPSCVLRVAIIPAGERAVLADGTGVMPDEPVADLHLWNERVPRVPAAGAGMAWAMKAQRAVELSLIELAQHLEAQPELRNVRAIRADAAFVTRLGRDDLAHLATLFGFERLPPEEGPMESLLRRLRDFWADFLVWALIWAFNRDALRRGRGFRARRDRIWMSRRALLRRYGSAAEGRR